MAQSHFGREPAAERIADDDDIRQIEPLDQSEIGQHEIVDPREFFGPWLPVESRMRGRDHTRAPGERGGETGHRTRAGAAMENEESAPLALVGDGEAQRFGKQRDFLLLHTHVDASKLDKTICLYKYIVMSSSLESLGLLIKTVQHRHHRALDAKLAPLGVSLVQWSALREIDRHAGLSMHGLAELTFNSDQAFGTLATRLLRRGLIERRPGPGRVTIHRLTAKGETLLDQGRAPVLETLAKSFAALSEDERALLEGLLTKMLGSGFGGEA